MRVRRAWEEHCAHPRLPQTLVPCLRAAGFNIAEISTFSITNTRLEQGTYSHGLLDLIRDFLLDRGTVEPDDLTAWTNELRSLSAEGRYFFTTTRCFFGVSKPAETPE